VTTPPPGTPNPGGGRLTGTNPLQRSIDTLTRAMTQSSSSWTRLLGMLGRGSGGATAGSAGHGGTPTFGMSGSAQAQWDYRNQQMQRMHATGMQDAQNAHVTARAAAERAHGLAQARWQNQQATYSTQLGARGISPQRTAAILRRADISNLQYQSSTDLRDQRVTAADTTFARSRDALNSQRDRLQMQYQAAQQRAGQSGAGAAGRQAATQQAAAQRARDRMVGNAVASAGGAVAGMAGRYATGIRDFNSGVDQYGRMVSLYGGFGGSFRGSYGNRAQRATGQGFGYGLQNVSASDSDMFTGMAALYRQNNFANMPAMERSAAATALVSPEMGVAGSAQLQSQMGTARAYYAGQMFGLAPSISGGGRKATPQQTFASLFSQVSPTDLGRLTNTQMKAMLAQGGSLQTTLENYANTAGIGSEGVQNAADYLTLSNRLRSRYKSMSQKDVDNLLGQAAKSGDAGDKARDTLKKAAPGVAESYIDAQRRATGAKREGKLDSSADYLTAAISAANTLVDIRELMKPVMAPFRKFLTGFSAALDAGGPVGVAGHLFNIIPGSGLVKSGVKAAAHGISGLFGGDSGAPKSRQEGSVTQPTASALGAGASASGAITFAESQLGKPYVYGSEGPDSWDCSSLTQAAYRSIGVSLPRTAAQQAGIGMDVPVKDTQPGDLLFYPDLSHVVMSLGNGKVIEAPHTGDVVKIEALNPNEYGRAKRIVGTVGQLSNNLSDASMSAGSVPGAATNAVSAAGSFGSTEEVDALAAALAGGSSVQQAAATGLSPSTLNTSAASTPGTTTPTGPSNPKGNIALGKQLAASLYGWTGAEWDALYQLWEHESNWNEKSLNPSSKAAGIPQALPGSKMASAGPDWRTNAATQIKWGLGYIHGRYGDPEKAWAFWQHPKGSPAGASTHWYEAGAFEIPDDQDARLHKGEMVLDRNTAHSVRQVLLKDSLRATDPTTGGSSGSVNGAVHLNFDSGSIQITMPDGSAAGAKQAARQFVDYVTADSRIRQFMGGY
jgi:cell wall-associated NlpC family hydrolase